MSSVSNPVFLGESRVALWLYVLSKSESPGEALAALGDNGDAQFWERLYETVVAQRRDPATAAERYLIDQGHWDWFKQTWSALIHYHLVYTSLYQRHPTYHLLTGAALGSARRDSIGLIVDPIGLKRSERGVRLLWAHPDYWCGTDDRRVHTTRYLAVEAYIDSDQPLRRYYQRNDDKVDDYTPLELTDKSSLKMSDIQRVDREADRLTVRINTSSSRYSPIAVLLGIRLVKKLVNINALAPFQSAISIDVFYGSGSLVQLFPVTLRGRFDASSATNQALSMSPDGVNLFANWDSTQPDAYAEAHPSSPQSALLDELNKRWRPLPEDAPLVNVLLHQESNGGNTFTTVQRSSLVALRSLGIRGVCIETHSSGKQLVCEDAQAFSRGAATTHTLLLDFRPSALSSGSALLNESVSVLLVPLDEKAAASAASVTPSQKGYLRVARYRSVSQARSFVPRYRQERALRFGVPLALVEQSPALTFQLEDADALVLMQGNKPGHYVGSWISNDAGSILAVSPVSRDVDPFFALAAQAQTLQSERLPFIAQQMLIGTSLDIGAERLPSLIEAAASREPSRPKKVPLAAVYAPIQVHIETGVPADWRECDTARVYQQRVAAIKHNLNSVSERLNGRPVPIQQPYPNSSAANGAAVLIQDQINGMTFY